MPARSFDGTQDASLVNDLPEGWATVPLVELVRRDAPIAYGILKPGDYRPDGVPMLRVKDIATGQVDDSDCYRVSQSLASRYQRTQLRGGEIVISIQGTVGRLAIVPSTLAGANVSRTLAVITPPIPELTQWLWIILQTPQLQRNIQDAISGTTRDSLNLRDLRRMGIPLPPIAEQRRIVGKVEALLAHVNRACEHLDRVPAIFKRFRQAVLAAASTGRLTADWREQQGSATESADELLDRILEARRLRYEALRSQTKAARMRRPKLLRNLKRQELLEEDSPELPVGWKWVLWNDLVDWITYGFTRPMPHVNKGVPIVTAKNILDGSIDFSTVDYTTAAAFSQLSEKDRPRKGEILLTKDGSIGRAAIVDTDIPFCINQSVAVLRFGGVTAHIPYLLRVIQSPLTQAVIEENAEGTAMRHISITTFGTFRVPLPPLLEQYAIARRVDALLGLLETIRKRLAIGRELVRSLPQAILAKAFRGELVPVEADLARLENRNYEPASELLARIHAQPSPGERALPRRTRRTKKLTARARMGRRFSSPS